MSVCVFSFLLEWKLPKFLESCEGMCCVFVSSWNGSFWFIAVPSFDLLYSVDVVVGPTSTIVHQRNWSVAFAQE